MVDGVGALAKGENPKLRATIMSWRNVVHRRKRSVCMWLYAHMWMWMWILHSLVQCLGLLFILVWVFIYLLCHAVLSHTCSTHMFTCQGKLLTGQDFKICMGLGGHLSSQLVDALGFSEISLSSKYISTWSEVRQHFNHKLGEILLNEIASKLNTLGTSKWKYFL